MTPAELLGIFEFKADELIAVPKDPFFFFSTDEELCFMS